MGPLQSSQEFVRALKASADPPVPGGPTKIETATEAWSQTSFLVPSKAEVIVDWILSRLLKDRAREQLFSPIQDVRYWTLLACILSSDPKTQGHRPIKVWLTSLLQRVPFGSVVALFLNSLESVPPDHAEKLADVASSVVAVVWPLAAQRISTELLQECFGNFLRRFMFDGKLSGSLTKIGLLVTTAYRNSLTNSSNKKKLYLSFLTSHLKSWLYFLNVRDMQGTIVLPVHEAGFETLFNLDVLRQTQETKSENALLTHLRSIQVSDRQLVLATFPHLFVRYIHSIKRHQSALYSQGSRDDSGASMTEVRNTGMIFFIFSQEIVNDKDQGELAWKTRAALLRTVNQENILNHNQVEAKAALNQIINLALITLDGSRKGTKPDVISMAIESLKIIAEIDYDLILPTMSQVLPRFLMIHGVDNAALGFFELILSYHVKTRTLDTLIDNLILSLSIQVPVDGSVQEEYQNFTSSPLLHPIHLNRLSVALQKFLTQSQTLPVIELICHHLNTTWEKFYEACRRQDADHGEGFRKRRKSMVLPEDGVGPEALAIRNTLAARLASVILSSLPLQSLPATMVEKAREILLNFRDADISRSILKSFNAVKKRERAGSWSKEIVIAAALRLLYAMSVSRSLSLQPHEDSEIFGNLEQGLNIDGLLPELHFEMIRVLMLRYTYQSEEMFEDVLDRVLTLVEKNFSPSCGRWSGQEHQLTQSEAGRINCALAILHMLLGRWLPLLDRMASPDHLRRLLELLLSIKLDPHTEPTNGLQPEHLLLQTLHSAQFWEFRNVRSTLLNVLDQSTSHITSRKLQQLKSSAIMDHFRTFRILLLFPIDYFPLSNLQTLMKKALDADSILGQMPFSKDDNEVAVVLTTLRVFLKRALEQNGSMQESNQAEEISKILLHLLKDTELDPECHRDAIVATLDLISSYLGKLLKLSQKQHHAPLLRVLALFKGQRFDTALNVRAESFLKLIDLLTGEFCSQTFPEEIVNALDTVHRDISNSLLPCLTSVARKDSKNLGVSEHTAAVWYRLLRLDSWLGLERRQEKKPPLVGRDLAARLLVPPSHHADTLYTYVFAILLQEFYYWPEAEHAQHLDLLVGIYVTFTGVLTHSVREDMDLYLGKFIRSLSPADFAHILSFVSESLLESTRTSPSNVLSLVHLAGLLLREHPSHTLVHSQKFVTNCIGIFCKHANFVRGPIELRLQTLELIMQHCSDQAALRPMDVAGIWSLLGAFLAPCKTHGDVTETLIFHKIIAILTSLIRFRRDLVSHTLPHLGMILRRLVLTLRGCRPGLGGRQTALVMNMQPQWISSAHPLRADEAKALARLLESLNTKTTIKVLSTPLDKTQKAESLAKPFSKHAAYVLKAYIEAMNDPLCVLPLDVRRELQPGLFSLCGMISEHSRDAMMVSSLDTGGKATMKALWKEYEKQRYVGKG